MTRVSFVHFVCIAWMLLGQTASATAQSRAPEFVYGRQWTEGDQTLVQRDEDLQPHRLMRFAAPRRPGLGVVRANFFIPERIFQGQEGVPGIDGHGNDRGFSPDASAFPNKVAIQVDFERGEGLVFVEASCIDVSMAYCLACAVPPVQPLCLALPAAAGFGTAACTVLTRQPFCLPPHEIRADPSAKNYFASELTESGSDFFLALNLRVANAFSDYTPIACNIDDFIDLYTIEGSEPRVRVAGDPYPAAEVYWYPGDGSPARTLYQREADPRGPGEALCPDPGPPAPPYRIMLTGDSITHGKSDDITWRYRLYEHLRSTGTPVDFVGPYDGPFIGQGDARIEGLYAPVIGENWDDDHNATWGRMAALEVDTIRGFVQSARPDLVVVALGTNDLNPNFGGPGSAATIENVRRIIRNAREVNADLDFILVRMAQTEQLLPQRGDIDAYNRGLDELAATEDTELSVVVASNVHDAFDYQTDTYDGTHLSVRGEYVFAKTVADTLWSDFQLGGPFDNVIIPPPPPKPQGLVVTPNHVTPDQPFTARWNSVGDGITYQLEVHHHTAFGFARVWPLQSTLPIARTEQTYDGPPLDLAGVYHVVVFAVDAHYQKTMSDPVELTVGGPPRVSSVAVAPAGPIGRSQLFTVSWPRVDNPDVWTTYRVELRHHRDFGGAVVWRSAETAGLEATYTGPSLDRAGTYQIFVVTLDGQGESESEPLDLPVLDGGPPRPAAVVVEPRPLGKNGLFEVRWDRVNNPGVWTPYRVELRTHRDFGYGLVWASAETPNTHVTYSGDTLPFTGIYHVVVVALDGTLEAASEPVELEVHEGGPPRPTGVRVTQAPIGRSQLFTVAWDRVDNPGVWTPYRVEVRYHRAFGYDLVWKSGETPATEVIYTGDTLPAAGTYHVVVVALDGTYEAASTPVELVVHDAGPAKPETPRLVPSSIVIGNSFDASWPVSADASVQYRVEVRHHGSFGFALVWSSESTRGGNVAYTGPALEAGVYHVLVVASGGGYEAASTPAALEVVGSDAPP
jgi:lysophospholipase L1-like esterase